MDGVFHRRCGDAAEQRELPERADAIRAQREHGAHCKTVHGADGREQKALPHAVLRVHESREELFEQIAQKAVAEKIPEIRHRVRSPPAPQFARSKRKNAPPRRCKEWKNVIP